MAAAILPPVALVSLGSREPEAALAQMPELHRRTTKVYAGETLPLDV